MNNTIKIQTQAYTHVHAYTHTERGGVERDGRGVCVSLSNLVSLSKSYSMGRLVLTTDIGQLTKLI